MNILGLGSLCILIENHVYKKKALIEEEKNEKFLLLAHATFIAWLPILAK